MPFIHPTEKQRYARQELLRAADQYLQLVGGKYSADLLRQIAERQCSQQESEEIEVRQNQIFKS
jgi:hypothetical protein